MTASDLENQRRLVAALGLPIVETHISYVLLGGEYAYKVKKAVNLEFLDFTTLEKRSAYCHEELRLRPTRSPDIRTPRRLAQMVVDAGYSAIVDAAFLQRWQRDLLRAVAVDLSVSFTIADCSAPEPVLRERVMKRLERGRDASEATTEILEHQLAHADPLSSEELALRQ